SAGFSTSASAGIGVVILSGVVTWSVASSPVISGSLVQGQTLTSSTGTWNGTQPLSYSYQWSRCDSAGNGCVAISGATGQSYLLGSEEVTSALRALAAVVCRVLVSTDTSAA